MNLKISAISLLGRGMGSLLSDCGALESVPIKVSIDHILGKKGCHEGVSETGRPVGERDEGRFEEGRVR